MQCRSSQWLCTWKNRKQAGSSCLHASSWYPHCSDVTGLLISQDTQSWSCRIKDVFQEVLQSRPTSTRSAWRLNNNLTPPNCLFSTLWQCWKCVFLSLDTRLRICSHNFAALCDISTFLYNKYIICCKKPLSLSHFLYLGDILTQYVHYAAVLLLYTASGWLDTPGSNWCSPIQQSCNKHPPHALERFWLNFKHHKLFKCCYFCYLYINIDLYWLEWAGPNNI